MYFHKGPTYELSFNNYYYEHLMDIKEKGKIWMMVIASFQFWVVWSLQD